MSRMTPEGKVKERIKRLFAWRGVWYCMPLGQAFGRRGVPDFLACCNGRFLAVEAKADNGHVTAIQKLEMSRITNAGGAALVVRGEDMEDLIRWIDEATSHASPKRGSS